MQQTFSTRVNSGERLCATTRMRISFELQQRSIETENMHDRHKKKERKEKKMLDLILKTSFAARVPRTSCNMAKPGKKEKYVSIPWILFLVTTITELTRNSRILFAATLTGSDGEATATLEVCKAKRIGNTTIPLQYLLKKTVLGTRTVLR